MKIRIILLLSLCFLFSSYSEDNTQQILKEVQKNLASIRNASYKYATTSWLPFQTEEDVMPYDCETFELEYLDDPYAGSQFITKDRETGEIIMCYDGTRRMRTNCEDKTYEIDSLFKGHPELRVVGVPFYHTCKRMVDYALNPADSISLALKEREKIYEIDIKIFSELQVEFSMAKPDPHLPEDSKPYIEDPTGHYILVVDKQTMLPREYYRLLCHDSSHVWITSEPIFNQEEKRVFNCFDYIPEGYISLKEKDRQAEEQKVKTTKDLIGKECPQWELKDEKGQIFRMSELRGKKLVLMFTGIGCGPCKQAIPYLNQLSEKYDKSTLQVIAFECWGRKAKDIVGYKQHNDIRYDMLFDGASITSLFNLGSSVPQFIIVDSTGIITHHFEGWGSGSGDEISKALSDLQK